MSILECGLFIILTESIFFPISALHVLLILKNKSKHYVYIGSKFKFLSETLVICVEKNKISFKIEVKVKIKSDLLAAMDTPYIFSVTKF